MYISANAVYSHALIYMIESDGNMQPKEHSNGLCSGDINPKKAL